MKLTSDNVIAVMQDCFYPEGTDCDFITQNGIEVDGVTAKFSLDPEKIKVHDEDIASMLDELDERFKQDVGGGWSFLNLHETKDHEQWGEHKACECLCVLGIASKRAEWCMPRKLWKVLLGGIPYFMVRSPL